jgi:dTDP-4-dehydrorhamnose reductase
MRTGSAKVLVIGRNGQIAQALHKLSFRSRANYHFVGRPEIDLGDPGKIDSALAAYEPHLVVNAAAWTAVDLAQSDAQTAYQINARAPGIVADYCNRAGIPLMHFSTDYVFNGYASTPYAVGDPVDPLNVYGASKAAGETAVRNSLKNHVILRLAWLYSESGGNFVNTMLRLATESNEIKVVDDQRGSPTFASDAALAIDIIVNRIVSSVRPVPWGTYHLTNSGETTWYGLAEKVFDRAHAFGHPRPVVHPIRSKDYPSPARRPSYSVLDTSLTQECFGIALPDWQDALSRCIRNRFSKLQPRYSL